MKIALNVKRAATLLILFTGVAVSAMGSYGVPDPITGGLRDVAWRYAAIRYPDDEGANERTAENAFKRLIEAHHNLSKKTGAFAACSIEATVRHLISHLLPTLRTEVKTAQLLRALDDFLAAQ